MQLTPQGRFVVLCMIVAHLSVEGKILYPTRFAKVQIIPNSYYVPAHYKHLISTILHVMSTKKCMYTCQNHDYCRTAVYNGQTAVCSLYEEYSFVGQVRPSLVVDQSVIRFSFCPGNVDEPTSVCFATSMKPSKPIDQVIRQTFTSGSLVRINATAGSSLWSTTWFTLAPMWAFDRQVMHDTNNDYIELGYTTSVAGINIASLDGDEPNYYVLTDLGARSLFIASRSLNTTIHPTNLRTVCLSDQFVIAPSLLATNRTIYVYWRSNGSKAFFLPAPNNGVTGCIVVNEALFLIGNPPNPPIQSVPLSASSTSMSNYSVIVSNSDCPQAVKPIKIDSSGRLFVSCRNASNWYMLVFTSNGTILARIYNSFFSNTQLGIKATKYRYSLAASVGPATFIYEV